METSSSKININNNSKSTLYRINSVNNCYNNFYNDKKEIFFNTQKKNLIQKNNKSFEKSVTNQRNKRRINNTEIKSNMIKKFNVFLVDNEEDEIQKSKSNIEKHQVRFSFSKVTEPKSKSESYNMKNNKIIRKLNNNRNKNNENSMDGYISNTSSNSSYYEYFGGRIKKPTVNQKNDYTVYHRNYTSSSVSSSDYINNYNINYSNNYNNYNSKIMTYNTNNILSKKDEESNNKKLYRISFNDDESPNEMFFRNNKITLNNNNNRSNDIDFYSYPSIKNYYSQSNVETKPNSKISNRYVKSSGNNDDISKNDLSELDLSMPNYYIDSLSESSECSNISSTLEDSKILENIKDPDFSFSTESESLLRLEKSLNLKFPRLSIFNELKLKYGLETKSDVTENESNSITSLNSLTYDPLFDSKIIPKQDNDKNSYYYSINDNRYFLPQDKTEDASLFIPNRETEYSTKYYNNYYYSSSVSDQKSSDTGSLLCEVYKKYSKNDYNDNNNNKSKKYNSFKSERNEKHRKTGFTLPLNVEDKIRKTDVENNKKELIKIAKPETESIISSKSSSSEFSKLSSSYRDSFIKPIIKEKQMIPAIKEKQTIPTIKEKQTIPTIKEKQMIPTIKEKQMISRHSQTMENSTNPDTVHKKKVSIQNIINHKSGYYITNNNEFYIDIDSNKRNNKKKINKNLLKLIGEYIDNGNYENKDIILIIINDKIHSDSYTSNSSNIEEKINNKKKKTFKKNMKIIEDDNRYYNKSNSTIHSDNYSSSLSNYKEISDNKNKKSFNKNKNKIEDCNSDHNISNSNDEQLKVRNNKVEKVKEIVKSNNENDKPVKPLFFQIGTNESNELNNKKSNSITEIVSTKEIESKPSFIYNPFNILSFMGNFNESIGSNLDIEKNKPEELTASLSNELVEDKYVDPVLLNNEPVKDKLSEVASLSNESVKDKSLEVASLSNESIEDKSPEVTPLSNESIEDKSPEVESLINEPVEDKSPEVTPLSNESIEDKSQEIISISNELIEDKSPEVASSSNESIEDKSPEVESLINEPVEDKSPEVASLSNEPVEDKSPEVTPLSNESIEDKSQEIISISNEPIEDKSPEVASLIKEPIEDKSPEVAPLSNELIEDKFPEIVLSNNESLEISSQEINNNPVDFPELTKEKLTEENNAQIVTELVTQENNDLSSDRKTFSTKDNSYLSDEIIKESDSINISQSIISNYDHDLSKETEVLSDGHDIEKIQSKELKSLTSTETTKINSTLNSEANNNNDSTKGYINELKQIDEIIPDSPPKSETLINDNHVSIPSTGKMSFKDNVITLLSRLSSKESLESIIAPEKATINNTLNNESKNNDSILTPTPLNSEPTSNEKPVEPPNLEIKKPKSESKRKLRKVIDITRFISSIRNREENLKAKENEFLKVIDKETEKNKIQKNMIQKTSDELNDKIKEVRQLTNEVSNHKKILLEQKEANDQLQEELEEEKKETQNLQQQLDSQNELNSRQEQEISYYKEVHNLYLEENQRLQALLSKLKNAQNSTPSLSPPAIPTLTLPPLSSPISVMSSSPINSDISPASLIKISTDISPPSLTQANTDTSPASPTQANADISTTSPIQTNTDTSPASPTQANTDTSPASPTQTNADTLPASPTQTPT